MAHKDWYAHLLILLVAVLLIAMPKASGEPPFGFQIASGTDDFQLVYPKVSSFKKDTNFSLHFHVFNASGYPLSDAMANCSIHIYYANNSHAYRRNLTPDGQDYAIKFYTNNMSDITGVEGNYPYIAFCNSSSKGGFVSTVFSITRRGEATVSNVDRSPVATNFWLLTLTIIFIFGAVLFYHARHPLVFLFTLLAFAMLLFTTWFNMVMMEEMALPFSGIMIKLFWAFGIILFFILVVVMIHLTRWSLMIDQEKKMKQEFARFGSNEK